MSIRDTVHHSVIVIAQRGLGLGRAHRRAGQGRCAARAGAVAHSGPTSLASVVVVTVQYQDLWLGDYHDATVQ